MVSQVVMTITLTGLVAAIICYNTFGMFCKLAYKNWSASLIKLINWPVSYFCEYFLKNFTVIEFLDYILKYF